jgi:hypothetical protein
MDSVNSIAALATLAGARRTGVQKNPVFNMALITLRG